MIMHPTDAAQRGITTGQYVRVFNDRGRYTARAEVSTEIAPGVVISPMGAWRKFTEDGATVNAVNPVVFSRPR